MARGPGAFAAAALAPMRKCLQMIPRELKARLLLALPLNVLVALFESVSAAAIYGLVQLVSDPRAIARLPGSIVLARLLPQSSPRALILSFTALLAGFYVAKVVLTVAAIYISRRAQRAAAGSLAATCFRAHLTAPYAFHFTRHSADIAGYVNRVIPETLEMVLAAYNLLFVELLVTGGLVVVMLLAAPAVTLSLCVLAVAGLLLFLGLTHRRIARAGAQVETLTKQKARHVARALGARKEIQVLAREPHFLHEYDRITDGEQRGLLQKGVLESLPRVVVEAVFAGAGLAAIALYIVTHERGAGVVPLLGLYAYAAFRMIPTSSRLANAVNEIRFRRPALERVYDDYVALMASAPTANASDAADDPVPHQLADSIVFDGVGFAYASDGRFALRDLSLTFARGESYGIVGPTGAGKSTVIDLLLGLLTPTHGRITVDGRPLAELGASFRRSVGYVPQAIYLADDSIRNNVAFGIASAEIDDARVWAALELAQLDAFVRGLQGGLDTEIGERGVRLSGGQRQRIGIARALYHDPAVLVFDEATSSLDNATESELSRAIEALLGTKTIIVVAHRLSTVEHCDRLYFLVDGQLEAAGSYAQLVQSAPSFRRMALAAEQVDASDEGHSRAVRSAR